MCHHALDHSENAMQRLPIALLVATALAHSATAAEEAQTDRYALTIYSSMSPGAISPELYRGGSRGRCPATRWCGTNGPSGSKGAATASDSQTWPSALTPPP